MEVEVVSSKKDFTKKHKPSGHKDIVQGVEKYRWICSCGATLDLPMNSGILLGVKIQWQKH